MTNVKGDAPKMV